ncbi:hypothetical protein M5689_008461 [Euphorbia peplus]|nr:hypothetical protein M5689_008461 [Euphorbia peplus]
MNSMFSSFDAFSFELLGRKINSSFASATTLLVSPKPSSAVQPPQKKKLAARFAPELDGLNCFETLVGY